jgi:hypothetical protein
MTKLGKNILRAMLVLVTAVGIWHFAKETRIKLKPMDYGQARPPVHTSLIRIASSSGICSATVFSKNYAITAGHCVAGQVGKTYKIYGQKIGGSEGARSELVGEAIAVRGVMYGGIDLGLLMGDFESFNYAPVHFGDMELPPLLVSCGYAGGGRDVLCRQVSNVEPYGFIATGRGNLIPGMSGGPLIDPATGIVVGVNSAQYENGVFFTPTTAADAFLGLDRIGSAD